jgi:hypothetical protein
MQTHARHFTHIGVVRLQNLSNDKRASKPDVALDYCPANTIRRLKTFQVFVQGVEKGFAVPSFPYN